MRSRPLTSGGVASSSQAMRDQIHKKSSRGGAGFNERTTSPADKKNIVVIK